MKELKEKRKKRPLGPWRGLDILTALLLMGLPFLFYSRYQRLNIPVAGFGLVLGVAQMILNWGERKPIPIETLVKAELGIETAEEPDRGRKRRLLISLIVRCVGSAVLVLYCAVIFGFGGGIRGMYPVRKAVYKLGNYSLKAQELEFLPDSLPKGISELETDFICPGQGLYTYGHIEISFIAGEEGVETFRQTALDKGGVLCGEEDLAYTKLRYLCEKLEQDYTGMEVYLCGEITNNCPAYLIVPETGFCAVYW